MLRHPAGHSQARSLHSAMDEIGKVAAKDPNQTEQTGMEHPRQLGLEPNDRARQMQTPLPSVHGASQASGPPGAELVPGPSFPQGIRQQMANTAPQGQGHVHHDYASPRWNHSLVHISMEHAEAKDTHTSDNGTLARAGARLCARGDVMKGAGLPRRGSASPARRWLLPRAHCPGAEGKLAVRGRHRRSTPFQETGSRGTDTAATTSRGKEVKR